MRRLPETYAQGSISHPKPTIVAALRQHHAWLLDVLHRAVQTESPARRAELAHGLRHHWACHAQAEEACVYWLFDHHERTKRAVSAGRTEHAWIAQLLRELFQYEVADEVWREAARELMSAVESHALAEESELYAQIALLLDRTESQALGELYQQIRIEGVAAPIPHMLSEPAAAPALH